MCSSRAFCWAEALIDNDRRAEGGLLLLDALAIAEQIERPPNLERRIAATCNNLAWMLHDLSSRTQEDVALMRLAAQKSLAAWRRSGDWINVEQALYLEASVAFIAGEPAATLTLSAEGLQVIATNGKRPFDAARFHLLRAASFDALSNPHEKQVALAQADDAAKDIAIERLGHQFLAERAKVTPR